MFLQQDKQDDPSDKLINCCRQSVAIKVSVTSVFTHEKFVTGAAKIITVGYCFMNCTEKNVLVQFDH